jgi:4-amino-4-deoxy-L-arabinose transferase-like glycosyltransferase
MLPTDRVAPSRILRPWLLVVIVAIAVHLGSVPLFDSDEGRNAEVARAMAETNDYVVPRLNGLPYVDKPVIYFAAEAALMEVLGPTELAARLPAYLFTLATGAMIFWFARRLWGGDTPWIATIVFLAMPFTIAFARIVIFDSALTFFAVVGLVGCYLAVEEGNRRWAILAWAAMGLAMITKGPVTFVLVLFVAMPYAWRRGGLRVLFPITGLALFAAIVGPWVWGVSRVVPDFLQYVLFTETAARMTTPDLERTGPPWFFLPYLVAGALPWSIVAMASWRSVRDKRSELLYLLLWIAIPLTFFSLSQSKLPQYILPLMPAIALVIARVWPETRTRAASVLVAAIGCVLFTAPFVLHRTEMKPEVAAVADDTAIVLGIVFVLAGVAALFVRRKELVLVALTIPFISLPLITNPLMLSLSERRSMKSFVADLTPYLDPQTKIIGVEAYTGSLAFYLGRPVILLSDDASELTSNYLVSISDDLPRDASSAIREESYFDATVRDCCTPRIYIVRIRDGNRRAVLESLGWRAVADSARLVAYVKP